MVSRRTLLETLGVSATLGLAGCGGLSSAESDSETSTPNAATPTRTPTATLRPERAATSTRSPATTAPDPTPTSSPTATATPAPDGTTTATAGATPDGSAVTPAFTPSSGPAAHDFGTSVALSDGVALVDRGGESVAVFEADDDGWRRTTTLAPEGEAEEYSHLPLSMDLAGDTAFLGGIELTGNGAVDVVERVGDEWNRRARVTPDDPPEESYYNFGRSVAHDDGTLAVGAVNEPTTMVSYRGHVFVFEGSGGEWTQVADFGTDPHDLFGRSVAVSGDRLLVGAPAAGEGTEWDGTVFVYERSGGEWSRETTLSVEADDTGFGRQVALDGDTAVVAAVEAEESGRVYVFERTADGWTERESFRGARGADGVDAAGTVAIRDTTALVGAPRDDAAGEAVRLERRDEGWERTDRFVGGSRDSADRFGAAVALGSGSALVGAPTTGDDRPGRGYLFDL